MANRGPMGPLNYPVAVRQRFRHYIARYGNDEPT